MRLRSCSDAALLLLLLLLRFRWRLRCGTMAEEPLPRALRTSTGRAGRIYRPPPPPQLQSEGAWWGERED